MRWLPLVLVPNLAVASPHRDIDGDGFDDATLDHKLLAYGSAKGLALGTTPQSPRTPDLMIYAVEVVGDVNGDGFADVVFGDAGCGNQADDLPECVAGALHLFLGGPKRLATKPSQTITAASKDTMFGALVTMDRAAGSGAMIVRSSLGQFAKCCFDVLPRDLGEQAGPPPPGGVRHTIYLTGLRETDVPIGTEVWLVDP